MKFQKALCPLAALGGVMLFCTSAHSLDTSSESDPIAIFRNTKETKSVVVSAQERAQASALFGSVEDSRIDGILRRWAETWNGERTCEPEALNELQKELENEKLPHQRRQTLLFLSHLRATDRLDDVILLPFHKAGAVWVERGFKSPGVEITCPTQGWLNFIDSARAEKGKKYRRRNLPSQLRRALDKKEITKLEYNWFSELRKIKFDREAYPLEKVLATYRIVKDSKIPEDQKPSASPYMSERARKAKLTRRMELYTKYNPLQIHELARLLRFHADLVLKTKLNYTFRDKDSGAVLYEEKAAFPDQVIASTKVLFNKIKELQSTKNFRYVGIDLEDLVTASVEVGTIDASYVDIALKIDDFWNPKVAKGAKIKKWIGRAVGTGVIFIPPPYNVIATIAVVLMEAFVLRDKTPSGTPDLMGSAP